VLKNMKIGMDKAEKIVYRCVPNLESDAVTRGDLWKGFTREIGYVVDKSGPEHATFISAVANLVERKRINESDDKLLENRSYWRRESEEK